MSLPSEIQYDKPTTTSRAIIRELRLRNYRAFGDVRLTFDKITYLVGRNGAGKSTLMDALSFMSEAVTDSLATALERRGNLEGIRKKLLGERSKCDVCLAVVFEYEGERQIYGFTLGSRVQEASYSVINESLDRSKESISITGDAVVVRGDIYSNENTKVETSHPLGRQYLSLPLISGLGGTYAAVFDALRNISVHQFSTPEMRAEPKIGSAGRLERDGRNIGDVLKQITRVDREWIDHHLREIVPGLLGADAKARADRRVIVFHQKGESETVNDFDTAFMSDGTIRSLAVLLALRQTPRPSIVLLDEIEDSLHPHAQAVLLDAIDAASDEFPVVVSTHNPEILSHPTATPDRIRVVQWNDGESRVYRLNDEIRNNMKPPQTVGRLLRSNALWVEDQPSTTGAEDDFFKVS